MPKKSGHSTLGCAALALKAAPLNPINPQLGAICQRGEHLKWQAGYGHPASRSEPEKIRRSAGRLLDLLRGEADPVVAACAVWGGWRAIRRLGLPRSVGRAHLERVGARGSIDHDTPLDPRGGRQRH